MPPEDFAASFQFPLDLIRVTSEPMIDAEEAERVVATSIEEGTRPLTLPLPLPLPLPLTLTLTLTLNLTLALTLTLTLAANVP